jgi:hypothetical protein
MPAVTFREEQRLIPWEGRKAMDARYNWIIDNAPLRVAINVTAFVMWLGLAVALLAL